MRKTGIGIGEITYGRNNGQFVAVYIRNELAGYFYRAADLWRVGSALRRAVPLARCETGRRLPEMKRNFEIIACD